MKINVGLYRYHLPPIPYAHKWLWGLPPVRRVKGVWDTKQSEVEEGAANTIQQMQQSVTGGSEGGEVE